MRFRRKKCIYIYICAFYARSVIEIRWRTVLLHHEEASVRTAPQSLEIRGLFSKYDVSAIVFRPEQPRKVSGSSNCRRFPTEIVSGE